MTGGGPQASLWVSTKGSSVIRYSLTIPEPAERLSQINRALVAGTCIRCFRRVTLAVILSLSCIFIVMSFLNKIEPFFIIIIGSEFPTCISGGTTIVRLKLLFRVC